jgi:multicomponent Na+:H+ antiporter subunit C
MELFALSAISLVLVGLFGVISRNNIIRILLAMNILETGVNLFLVSLGYVPDGEAPILKAALGGTGQPRFVDPLPQALVLTSIVIGLGTTALALTLSLRYFRSHRSLELGNRGGKA